ncbi:hypothetical protein BV334_05584 [Pseudomonas syringae pv. actinidiae]|nr:hypothetical protein BV334_05584 [Pseudomonas syringae pv. actinidiae]
MMGLSNFMKCSAMVLKCCIVFKLRIFSYMVSIGMDDRI